MGIDYRKNKKTRIIEFEGGEKLTARKITGMIEKEIEIIKDLPVISGFYLVLGGGKIGTNFVEYSKEQKLPFVLVIDKDKNSPASQESEVIKNIQQLEHLLRSRKESTFREDGAVAKEEESNIYFYNSGIEIVPFILSFGIPEYIIPVVPFHAAAYLISYFMQFPMQRIMPIIQETKKEEQILDLMPLKNSDSSIVKEISVSGDKQMMDYFEMVASRFPEDLIAGRYPEEGVIMLSYAREGEICPDSCIGPESYCPGFNREKKETVTGYVRKAAADTNGWVFESQQMKGGIGGIRGEDLKEILLSLLDHTERISKKEKKREERGDEYFMIATTCNCHGVINLFEFK